MNNHPQLSAERINAVTDQNADVIDDDFRSGIAGKRWDWEQLKIWRRKGSQNPAGGHGTGNGSAESR